MGNDGMPSVLLIILDGFGVREDCDDNAVTQANAGFWHDLWAKAPRALIETSGEAVGLPEGQMGNSEVGHMNIGAGRVVYQDFTRIGLSAKKQFADVPLLTESLAKKDAVVHIIGLFSPGGVHSHEDHMLAAIDRAFADGAAEVFLHLIADGRDVPPRSMEMSFPLLDEYIKRYRQLSVASLCGRYYAMDRDLRWERVEAAYRLFAEGEAKYCADSYRDALQKAYARDESDEFISATRIGDRRGIYDGETVWFVNFRADRARQLTRAFVADDFPFFARAKLSLSAFVTMTEYQKGLPVQVAFPPQQLSHLLGEEIANNHMRQLRIAETEKYAHVTYFFNGGEEEPYPLEDRELIASPKVATYDLQPEMSLPQLTEKLVQAIDEGVYSFIACNFANPDMVGHTGKMTAALQAVEAVDQALQKICAAAKKAGMDVLITADHGNVEQMRDDATGQAHTAHTTNPVPLVYVGQRALRLRNGALCDLAPTILSLLDLPKPRDMTGRSLIDA